MDPVERMATLLALAFFRYLPPIVLPALTPLRWAPPMVRIVLALALSWLTVLATPLDGGAGGIPGRINWILAAMAEFTVGLVFGLVLMIPQAALHMAGWMVDVQAGLAAATLFNPGTQGDIQSMLGSALMLLATVLFFTLDLHIDLYRMLVASVHALPLGQAAVHLDRSAFLGLIGGSFVLALMVVMPVVLGLFAVDVGVAYATRSMPQANVYFLILPLKIAVALLLMAAALPLLPDLIGRLFRDAFARAPTLLGG